MGIGHTELIIILVIVLVLFGGSKIPEIMKGLGKGIRDFKSAKDGTETADKDKHADKHADKPDGPSKT